MRRHSILTELMGGKVIDLRPREEDPFPLCTPFRAPSMPSTSTAKMANPRNLSCVFDPL